MARKSGPNSATKLTQSSSSKTRSSSRSTRPRIDSSKDSDNATTPSKSASRKRKATDLTQNGDSDEIAPELSTKKQKKDEVEKRLKPFRPKAPQTFLQKLERATTQRMIVIGRTRAGQGTDLHEDIDIVGTTGNIYTVTIGRLPSCTSRHVSCWTNGSLGVHRVHFELSLQDIVDSSRLVSSPQLTT